MEAIKRLTIIKEDNVITELCIAYGLLSILNEFGIDVRLKNYKSAFVIELYEDVDYEELFIVPTDKEMDIKYATISSMVNKKNYELMVEKMFGKSDGFFEKQENIVSIFNYYETLDESYLSNFEKIRMVYVGSAYGAKGQRGYYGPNNPVVLEHVRWLATLGHFRATTYVEINKKRELTWLPIPSESGIKEVVRFDLYTYKDKENGLTMPLKNLTNDSLSVGLARTLLSIQEKMLQEQIFEEYEGVYMLTTTPGGQSPLNDKNKVFELVDLPFGTIEKLKEIVTDKNRSFDVKEATGKLITERTIASFNNFSKNISKFESNLGYKTLELTHTEEISHMFKQSDLFNSEGIRRTAQGLSMMMSKKKGYNIQVGLMNAVTPSQLIKTLQELSFIYSRTIPTGTMLKNEDLLEVLELAESEEFGATQVANMILLLSNTYISNKKTEHSKEEASVTVK